MDSITIAPALSEELEAAADLRAAMAGEMGNAWDDKHPGWRMRFAAYFRAKQEAGTAQVFFARSGDRAIGMAIMSVVDDYRNFALGQPRGYVNGVYVAPEYRRRGIARAIMQVGLEWLRERGVIAVRLRSSDEGRGLYTSLGFTPGTEMEFFF